MSIAKQTGRNPRGMFNKNKAMLIEDDAMGDVSFDLRSKITKKTGVVNRQNRRKNRGHRHHPTNFFQHQEQVCVYNVKSFIRGIHSNSFVHDFLTRNVIISPDEYEGYDYYLLKVAPETAQAIEAAMRKVSGEEKIKGIFYSCVDTPVLYMMVHLNPGTDVTPILPYTNDTFCHTRHVHRLYKNMWMKLRDLMFKEPRV